MALDMKISDIVNSYWNSLLKLVSNSWRALTSYRIPEPRDLPCYHPRTSPNRDRPGEGWDHSRLLSPLLRSLV